MNSTLEDHTTDTQPERETDCHKTSVEEALKQALERIDKSFEAAKEAISDTLERGERLLRRGQDAAEGYLDDAAHQIRHNPRSSLALAFAFGAIAGSLLVLMSTGSNKPPKRLDNSGDQ